MREKTLEGELKNMEYNERVTWTYRAWGDDDVAIRRGKTVGDAVCRLAEYEDIGLSPEEILSLWEELQNRKKKEELEKKETESI